MPRKGNTDFCKLSELAIGSYYNFYGIITSVEPKPRKCTGCWRTSIRLEDQTTHCPFEVYIFFHADKSSTADKVQPTWLKPYCVVRILQAKIEHNFSKNGLDGRVWGEPHNPFPVTLVSQDGSVFGDVKRVPLKNNDWACIQDLRKWIQPKILAAQPKPLEIPYKKISSNHTLISNITISQQCDLVCQVLSSLQLDNGQLDLVVLDGTQNTRLPDLCATVAFAHPTSSIQRLKKYSYILLKCVNAEVQSWNSRLTLSAGDQTEVVYIANEHDAAKFIRRQQWKSSCEKLGLPAGKPVPRVNIPDLEITPMIGFDVSSPPRKKRKTAQTQITKFRSTNPNSADLNEKYPPSVCSSVTIICEEQFPAKYVAPGMSHQKRPKGSVKKFWIAAITTPKDYSTHPKSIVRSYCLKCFMVFPYSVLETSSNDCPHCEKENQKGKLCYMFLIQFELVDTRGQSRRALFPTLEGNEEFGCSAADYLSQTDKQKLVLNQLDLLIYQEKCRDNMGLRSFELMRHKGNLIVRTSKCRLHHQVST